MREINPILLNKLKEIVYSKSNGTAPQMRLQVSRAKTTVTDNTYFTVTEIRKKEGLGEAELIARRMSGYAAPDKIFEIHIDNGDVIVSTREYPDLKKLAFQREFSLGTGKSCTIAFDGDWELYRKKWRLITEEYPFLFWIDTNGDLFVQKWDDSGTKIKLASGTRTARAIRGWKSANILEKDQGIVVAYIKDDLKVYYRNLCRQANGTLVWENEKKVIEFTGNALNLNLFLTNDYRLGIAIQNDANKISWHITGRNWAGMAIVPEKLRATAKCTLKPIKVNKKHAYEAEKVTVKPTADIFYLYAGTDNEFELIINTDYGNGDFGRAIYFKTKHPIRNIVPAEFKLMDADGLEFTVLSIMPTSETEYMLFTSDFNNAYGQLKITYMGDTLENPAGGKYGGFEGSFEPVNLVPVNIPIPEVVEVWNE